MTRINIVPPEELTDQHLFAEVREIRGVPRALARSLKKRGVPGVLAKVPADYTLGVGHMFFFFNKGFYLERRHLGLRMELLRRGITFDSSILFDPDGHYGTDAALQLDLYPQGQDISMIQSAWESNQGMRPNGAPMLKLLAQYIAEQQAYSNSRS